MRTKKSNSHYYVRVGDRVRFRKGRGENVRHIWVLTQIGGTDCESFDAYKRYMEGLRKRSYSKEDLSDTLVMLADGQCENETLLCNLKLA